MVSSGMDDQRAPAAADIQQPLPRGEVELAAHELELAPLGAVERGAIRSRRVALRLDEVGAGVHEIPVADAAVEVVTDVVVVADGRRIP